MEIVKNTVIGNIEGQNAKNGKVPAFESYAAKYDYHTIFEMKNVYRKSFLNVGVKNGETVSICSAGTLDPILEFYGLNAMGGVTQLINPNYFKVNSRKYINARNSKVLFCLDKFYPLIKDEIAKTNVELIVIGSISEYAADLFKAKVPQVEISSIDKIPGIKYMTLSEFIKLGERSNLKTEDIPYEPNKPALITYTSGTTSDPKGVLHTNDSMNAMLSIYQIANGFGASLGSRNLVLIPLIYLTSFMHSVLGPASMGATNILQPIYNPKALADDLLKYSPDTVVASKSHYINLEDSKSRFSRGSLSQIKAYCGGEAIFKNTASRINDILAYFGMPPVIICYGQTEFGTMVMNNSAIPYRVNESGLLIPEVRAKIIDPLTGELVEPGKRGELYIQTPTVMREYLDNPEATKKFFVADSKGEVWAKTGDVAAVIGKFEGHDVYEVSGRLSDSFIDVNGDVIYLFDIEDKVEQVQGVREAEVVAVTVDGKKVPVVHVVLDKETSLSPDQILMQVDSLLKTTCTNPSQIPYAYKVRESFATSPISGKRDYEILKIETGGYLMLNEFGKFEEVEIETAESLENNPLLRSKIMVREKNPKNNAM